MDVDYQYYVEEKKKVLKSYKLQENLIIKSFDYDNIGKRIVICGTTEKNTLFFAIYNTAYNLIEYLHEDFEPKEICKAIEVNTNTRHIIILTQRVSNSHTGVKAFSFESKALALM